MGTCTSLGLAGIRLRRIDNILRISTPDLLHEGPSLGHELLPSRALVSSSLTKFASVPEPKVSMTSFGVEWARCSRSQSAFPQRLSSPSRQAASRYPIQRSIKGLPLTRSLGWSRWLWISWLGSMPKE